MRTNDQYSLLAAIREDRELVLYPFATSKIVPDLAFALARHVTEVVEHQLPHLTADFPNLSTFDFKAGYDAEICFLILSRKLGGVPSGGEMDQDAFATLKSGIGILRGYESVKNAEGFSKLFDWDRLFFVLPVVSDHVDWDEARAILLDWMNDLPLQRALRNNLERVRLAIPDPPQFNVESVSKAVWVLECEEQEAQGTGFDLDGIGVVTNAHVVDGAKKLEAFRADTPAKRLEVRVLKVNPAIDLAVLEVLGAHAEFPLKKASGNIELNSHLAVCGFPNYRLGDSVILMPGIAAGFRVISGVRRILTNAHIVSGMSGGPVLGAGGAVVGVCVTGARSVAAARDTEDHAIIPIGAIDLL